MGTVWSPAFNDTNLKDKDINDIWRNHSYKNGDLLIHKTISYLEDKTRHESRWLESLKRLDVPTMVFWGDSDPLAPMDIPKYLESFVIPQNVFHRKILKDVGHFLMLEKPDEWAETVTNFIKKYI